MTEVDIKENEERDETEDSSPRKVLETWVADQDEKVQAMFKDGIAGLTSALQKERDAAKEAIRLQKELDEANQKLDGYKSDEEKELDTLTAKVDTLATEKADAVDAAAKAKDLLEKKTISFAVTVEALKMGFEDPSDAESLLPPDTVSIDEETGKIEGVKEGLKKLIEKKPYLLGTGDGVGTPRGSRKKKLSSDERKEPVTDIRF